MYFTGEELMRLLWELYLNCNRDVNAIYIVTKEQLHSLDERTRWRFYDGISILIRDGFLNRIEPATVAIPFKLGFSSQGIEAINEIACSSRSNNNNIPGIPKI